MNYFGLALLLLEDKGNYEVNVGKILEQFLVTVKEKNGFSLTR